MRPHRSPSSGSHDPEVPTTQRTLVIVNVHERRLPASPGQVGALLDRLFGPEDCLWPAERWPMHRSGELRIGAACHQTPSCRTEVSHLVPAEYRFRVKAVAPTRSRPPTAPGAQQKQGGHDLRPPNKLFCRLGISASWLSADAASPAAGNTISARQPERGNLQAPTVSAGVCADPGCARARDSLACVGGTPTTEGR